MNVLDRVLAVPLAPHAFCSGIAAFKAHTNNSEPRSSFTEQVWLFYGPGVVAVNAMHQNWAVDAVLRNRWVFTPFELVGEVIGKLQLEQTDAILVVPKFRRHWQVLLKSLPIVAHQNIMIDYTALGLGHLHQTNSSTFAMQSGFN